MGRRVKKERKQFNVGDFVFAKVRGFRAWPARVLSPELFRSYYVYFYGTCNIARVPIRQLFEYEKHKLRMGDTRQRASRSFKQSMEHIYKTVAQPDRDRGYFQAKAQLEREQEDRQSDTSSEQESSPTSPLELVVGKKLTKNLTMKDPGYFQAKAQLEREQEEQQSSEQESSPTSPLELVVGKKLTKNLTKDRGYFQAKAQLEGEQNKQQHSVTSSEQESSPASPFELVLGKKLTKKLTKKLSKKLNLPQLPFIHITGDSD